MPIVVTQISRSKSMNSAVISVLCVVFILPALFMLFDRLICVTTIGMKNCPKKAEEAMQNE